MEELKPTAANSTPLTPITYLERAAVVYGDSPSIIYNTTTFTWSETNRRCLSAASAIAALGIARRDVVSVVSPNVPAAYELHFAVPMTGAVLNMINTRLNSKTISNLLYHSESKLIFVYHQLQSLVLEALSLLPSNHPRPMLVVIFDDDRDHKEGEFMGTYEGMIKRGDPEFEWVRPTSDWDPIVLNFTSGTTSSPKGVVHCHRGAFIMSLDTLVNWSLPKQPVYLWIVAMFHSNGWSLPWALAAVGGISICLRRFDGTTIFNAIHSHGVTHMCAAPVVLNMLVNSPNARPLGRAVHVLTGGSPPPATVLQATQALGFIVDHTYGLSETLGSIISCTWKSQWDNLPDNEKAQLRARQGVRTISMTSFDVLDASTGKPVTRDGRAIGEVVLRGASIMLGYLKNKDETLKCMGNDGWFRTGDLAVMHPDGYIEIKGRSKDVIISGGVNINSLEVESVLSTHPSAAEAAVVAQPHEHWGETPCAFLVLKEDVKVKPSEKEIIEYCRSNLPHFMVPKKVVFKDELPKTSTGKIQKFVLRDMAKAMVLGPLKQSRL